MNLQPIIQDIKAKKELSSLDDSYIDEILNTILSHNSKYKKYLQENEYNKKSRVVKQVIKETRNILHKTYGVFQLNPKQKEILLKNLEKDPDSLELHTYLLATHSSTKERLTIYKDIYKKIFQLTLKPFSILDISAGLNPISFPYMDLPKFTKYYATELTKADCDFLNDYFKIENIQGEAFQLDLTKKVLKLPKTDVCFLFKTLETIELNKHHKVSEEIITKIPAKYVVVSFSLRTISNKKMNFPIRGWFLRMLKRLNYEYQVIEEPNEIFYIIIKKLN